MEYSADAEDAGVWSILHDICPASWAATMWTYYVRFIQGSIRAKQTHPSLLRWRRRVLSIWSYKSRRGERGVQLNKIQQNMLAILVLPNFTRFYMELTVRLAKPKHSSSLKPHSNKHESWRRLTRVSTLARVSPQTLTHRLWTGSNIDESW